MRRRVHKRSRVTVVKSSRNTKRFLTLLRQNPSCVGCKTGAEVVFKGESAILYSSQHEFLTLAALLTKRLTSYAGFFNKPVEVRILDSPAMNAYALWLHDCRGVVITDGLIDKLQVLCGISVEAMHRRLQLAPPDDTGVRFWGHLPKSAAYFKAFGQLLAHVSLVFLVHHEVAHLGCGHERFLGRSAGAKRFAKRSVRKGNTSINEAQTSSISGIAMFRQGLTESEVIDQSLEADADFNAMMFSLQYLNHQAERFLLETESDDQEHEMMRVVWTHILNDRQGLNFVCLFGMALTLIVLAGSSPTTFNVGSRSHPLIAMRILMCGKAYASLRGEDEPSASHTLMDSLLFAVSLVVAEARINDGPGNEHSAEGLQGSGVRTMDYYLDKLGVTQAVNSYESVNAHYRRLQAKMSALFSGLEKWRRIDAGIRFKWF